MREEEVALAGDICWRMWWIRNEVVHGSDGGVGEDIIMAANFLAAYRSAQLPRSPHLVHSHDCWQAPGARQVKVNFDVAFIDAEYYQIAVVARKEDVACLWWRVRRLAGQPSAKVGKARVWVLRSLTLFRIYFWRTWMYWKL